MNDTVPFEFEDSPVRVVMIDGDPWWVANDLAKLLGYAHTPHMVRILDDDERSTHIADTGAGQRSLTIVSESGMWKAVLKSRREDAKRVVRWLTGEVLPALRRFGHYAMPGREPPGVALAPGDLDAAKLQAQVATVRLALRLFGPAAARRIWCDVGLPRPIADARPTLDDDLRGRLELYMADRDETSLAAAALALGFDEADYVARRRISEMLTEMGLIYKAARRGGRKGYYYIRPRAGDRPQDGEMPHAEGL